MPGTAAHLSIIELEMAAAKAQPNQFGFVADAINKHKKEAYLGSIGPDMIFWADWGEYTDLVNAIFDVYKTIDEVVDKINKIFGPINDALAKVGDKLTGGLTTEIGETADLLSKIIATAFQKYLVEAFNLYKFLRPANQTPTGVKQESEWNWLDFLHHRGTGRMTKTLIERAKGNQALSAYAYGWMSHVTADVVGHAYVNTAVGGPWRTHSQRHHLQENFMDVWTWGFYHTPGVTMAPANFGAPYPYTYFNWTNLNKANLHELINFGDDLPKALKDLIADAINQTYAQEEKPTTVNIGESEVNRAYQMLLFALELMTGKDRHVAKPTPPEVFDDLEGAFPPPPPFSGGLGGGAPSSGGAFDLGALLTAIFAAIGEMFSYIGDVLKWLATLPAEILNAATYPVRYGLYLIQLGLYSIFRDFRWALVTTGYMFPEPEELATGFAQQFINPQGLLRNYPHLEYMPYAGSQGQFDNSQHYPGNGFETPVASPGPYNRFPINYPYWFIQAEPTDADVEVALIAARSPEETRGLTANLAPKAGQPYKGSLGCARDLFLRRAREITQANGSTNLLKLPDWNLDADQGYGFKCWQNTKPMAPAEPPVGQMDPPTYQVNLGAPYLAGP